MTHDYLRDPDLIYRQSFARIRAEADLSDVPPALLPVVLRLIHACGMPDIVGDLAWGGDVAGAGRGALRKGAPVFVDANMVAHGLTRRHLEGNDVICALDKVQAKPGDTRSALAVDLWRERLAGAVVAFGNAPTALFRLLEMLQDGADKPAVILGFPVGFVGAAESKQALIEAAGDIPFLTLKGRRGGSAMAAAAVNALALPDPEGMP